MTTHRIATLAAVLSIAALSMAPGLTHAETAKKALKPVAAASTEAKPKVKAKAKPRLHAKAAKPAGSAKPAINPNQRTNLKSATKNVAAGIGAAEAALTPAELAVAERVHVGYLPCELGASVTLTADARAPGYFNMQGKNFSYRMFPVMTSTGAVRLEDPKAGAVWLQLANKSMLMNQKQGIRLADECMSPAQLTVAQALKINPAASILDPVRPALVAPVAPAAADPLMQLVPSAR
ncbi:MAG: hypothetical protein M3R45_15665 [Pseudomonadota bacterium]|nr:hypothetical protein [Pseudomonadota bacterium]